MNKILETIRGSWITREHEIAEADREYLRTVTEQIPTELREKFLNVLEWSDLAAESVGPQPNRPSGTHKERKG